MKGLISFSERLSELMFDAANITTDKLGEAIGTSGALVRMWRLGKNIPSLANAVKIADFFNCSLDFLFGRSDVPTELYSSIRNIAFWTPFDRCP